MQFLELMLNFKQVLHKIVQYLTSCELFCKEEVWPIPWRNIRSWDNSSRR